MSGFFRKREAEPAPEPPRKPTEPPLGDGSQTLYVTGDARRDTDRIRLLVESLREVSSTLDPDQLLVTMVDRAVKLVGAERGLLFTTDRDGRPMLRVGRDAAGRDLPANAAFSTRVVETVLAGGKSVCEKIDAGGDFDPSRSMIDLNIRAVMSVPLVAQEKRLGVLCVDTRASERTFSRSDLRYFEAFADMLAMVWVNRQAVEERLRAERMRQDLDLARNIQRDLVPERPLVAEGYSMCGRVVPAAETGGDYFDFFRTRDDMLAMVLGDVSGHGIGAALIMAAARAYLRAFCQSSSSPRSILRRVNRALGLDIADDLFMSMFLCVLDPRTRDFYYANAGQTNPVLLHAGTLETEDYRVTGIALGVEDETDYEERGPYRLDPGDTVVMFSDGLTELRKGEELYGRARVIQSIKRHGRGSAEQILEGVFKDALDWAPDENEHIDDLTVAVLRADN
ncbi:MAG TPA: SpoIIE family protein phosphatase [Planctomycetota bacterium]|nr:SpoIIE family protein phosphatase [Planctomycetota bacterium]